MKIVSKLKRTYNSIYIWMVRKRDSNGVEYIWKRRGSNKLIIVFSAMGYAPFNYIYSLRHSPYDQLFIRDSWASNASYYWFENGQEHPERYTQDLITHIVNRGGYSSVVTVGSSKGGTAAIYYGLKNNAELVYAGACQYYVGDYLSRHQYVNKPWQWQCAVGGKPTKKWIDILDYKLANMIELHSHSKTLIRLLYSTEEHTYSEHIVPLIKKLDECGIKHIDQIEKFEQHSMVGIYFRDAINTFFNGKQHTIK